MSDVSSQEWRFIFDISLMSLLFLLLLLTLFLILYKQKNVPVSQCIEVDPREPHSITITFVPAQIIGTRPNSNIESGVAGTSNAIDAQEMTQRSSDNNPNQTTPTLSQSAPLA